ncbi:MAG TPA: SAM-dependent methyltransferase [Beijerinckiaceae bacterium]|nr:SAM-dependent methyltransferase [Beijerinckiaceae bacterium]
MTTRSLPRSYFENLYAPDPDPWRFATSLYERDKYLRTLAALRRPIYASALEAGCSIGVLTRQLAARCESLTAFDIASAPLVEARRRCDDISWVRFERLNAPSEWPAGNFDLILLSEIVYYLDRQDIRRLATRIEESLARNGDLLLVHWTGPTDYPMSGDDAVESLLRDLQGVVSVIHSDRAENFRLDLAGRG